VNEKRREIKKNESRLKRKGKRRILQNFRPEKRSFSFGRTGKNREMRRSEQAGGGVEKRSLFSNKKGKKRGGLQGDFHIKTKNPNGGLEINEKSQKTKGRNGAQKGSAEERGGTFKPGGAKICYLGRRARDALPVDEEKRMNWFISGGKGRREKEQGGGQLCPWTLEIRN